MSSTGPNGDTASTVYDPNTARPTSSTSVYGAVTAYTYANAAPQVTATVNGRWSQTYLDGLGRTYRVASGYTANGSNTTLSYTDTIYDTCGCTPVGKPYQTSMPYAPGATPVYKVNTYDALGRTLTTVLPDGASTTSYSYQGNTVTITDPAGKWKQYTMDAFGELTQVLEPSPNPGTEPNHVTTYTYDVLGHLIQAQMPRTINGTVVTQTRAWTYSPTTQWLSSVTQPETGTTSFTYNSDGTMATKTDAKSQQTQYTYDSYGDLIQVSRGTVSGGTFTEDIPQRVTYTYGGANAPNNASGRVQTVTYNNSPGYWETYQYTAPGQVTNKTLNVGTQNQWASLTADYTYDNEGRMLTVTYPYDPLTEQSPQYTYGFDPMGRLSTLSGGGGPLIGGVTYNAANQALSGLDHRTYNVNGQLTELTAGSYHYKYNFSTTQNNGRIASMQDVASGEAITYTYDSLNRLTGASGTGDPQGNWSQTFSYDGFGNLLSKLGNNAPNVTSWTVNPATNQITSNGAVFDSNGNMTAYGPTGQVTGFGYDEANRVSQVRPPGNPYGNPQAQYSYDTANQRIYASVSAMVNNVYTTNNYIYFYGADGKKLGVWQLTYPYGYATLTNVSYNVWFGGRLYQSKGLAASEDRLQSIGKYFPYGEDRYNPTPANPPNDQEKFATYTRDSISGLDYALNRYYSAGMGRFSSPDPYGGSARPMLPQTMNRYIYAQNDPVEFTDPTGLDTCGDIATSASDTVGSEALAGTAQAHFIDLVWHEGGTFPEAGNDASSWVEEFEAIGQAIENRVQIVEGNVSVTGANGITYAGAFAGWPGRPGAGTPTSISQSGLGYGNTCGLDYYACLNETIYNAGKAVFDSHTKGPIVGKDGALDSYQMGVLESILDSDQGDESYAPGLLAVATTVGSTDSYIWVSAQCFGVIQALQVANTLSSSPFYFDAPGYFPTSWGSGNYVSPNYPAKEGLLGFYGGTVVFGFLNWKHR
jgi:RHS repeat-associated protein